MYFHPTVVVALLLVVLLVADYYIIRWNNVVSQSCDFWQGKKWALAYRLRSISFKIMFLKRLRWRDKRSCHHSDNSINLYLLSILYTNEYDGHFEDFCASVCSWFTPWNAWGNKWHIAQDCYDNWPNGECQKNVEGPFLLPLWFHMPWVVYIHTPSIITCLKWMQW